ncbi:hypothetical protein ACFSO7_08070 [Bacillus sp. CGMCC 1.16607]|uniref:hypothetical protein n=1 Tax=Bacillus sp. CGMCC 1.16607 TaxID=3351842 RepID=UPI00363D20CD
MKMYQKMAALLLVTTSVVSLMTGCGSVDQTQTEPKDMENKIGGKVANDQSSSNIEIKHEGTGILVGRIDPHSIEINMNGEPFAFQLTDFAMEQLIAFEDGVEVKFIYTDTKIEQKTIEKFIVEPNKIVLQNSVLELDEEILGLFNHIKENRSLVAVEGYQPFDIFRLYMYTEAGEDYGTLYHFYPEGSMEISEDQFIKEARNEVTSDNTRKFMTKLNKVREFEVIQNEHDAAVNFIFEGEEHGHSFHLKRVGNSWFVKPLPLQ